jgi:hypothetical protein
MLHIPYSLLFRRLRGPANSVVSKIYTHSAVKKIRSFSTAFFLILETYDREMPSWRAILRCVFFPRYSAHAAFSGTAFHDGRVHFPPSHTALDIFLQIKPFRNIPFLSFNDII